MMKLAVFLGDMRVGTLSQSSRASFSYDESYLAQTDPTPLSLSLPLQERPHGNRVTLSWVAGLLPANPGVRARIAERGGVKASNPIALLSVVGLDCPGAVQICPAERTDELRRGAALVAVDEDWIAARLTLLRQDGAAWQIADERWSIGGGQSKFTVAKGLDGRWYDPKGAAASTHIVKPGVQSAKYQALNEHICLSALRGLGIPVARTEYREFGGEPAVVVERFDRTSVDEIVQRRHAEDLCQALGNQTTYEHQGGPTARQILSLLGNHAGERGRRRFVDALIATYLLGSPDGHARNYSVLLEGNRVALAPLYDVASSLPYDVDGDGVMNLRKVAISIGGERQFGMVGRDQWRRFFTANGIDQDWGFSRIRFCAERLPDALADVFTALGDVRGANELSERLTDAVGQSCHRMLAQLR